MENVIEVPYGHYTNKRKMQKNDIKTRLGTMDETTLQQQARYFNSELFIFTPTYYPSEKQT